MCFQSQKSKLSTPTDKLRIIKIIKVKKETPTIKSFIFSDEKCSKAIPGQFVMAWIPDLDEIPMSLSKIGLNSNSAITVKKLGEASEAFHRLKSGDRIGIRGPYGRGFTTTTGNILIVGGGIRNGTAAKEVVNAGANIIVTGTLVEETSRIRDSIYDIVSQIELVGR